MKKIILAGAAAALIAGPAWAEVFQGKVTEFNKEGASLTLDSGKTFVLPPEAQLPPELAVGKQVSIKTDDNDATRVESVTLDM